jgi:hypothetical protein
MNMRLGLSLVLFGLALFGIPTHASLAAPASFGRPQHLVLSGDDWPNPSTWQQPVRHVAIGDINGDGRKDLAATYWIPEVPHYRLWIFLQRGDGTLAAPVDLPLATNTNIGGSVFTDLDGDGAQEVVVGSWLGPLIVVGMTEAGTFSVLAHGPEVGCKFMTTEDVDSDENSDIVCLDKEHTATVLYGNGSGGFRAASVEVQTLGGAVPSSSDTKSVHTADVTGDGHPDLLVTATFVGSFYVHPNDGNGGFLRAIAYKHPDVSNWYAAPAIVALDVDGDGANEVATLSPNVDRPNATLNLYKRGLDGRLFLWRRTPIQDRPHALIAGDVGGDGDVDLVSAHYLFNTATVFGEGTGSALPGQARYDLPGFGTVFADNSPEDFFADHPNSIALGDLNGDGCNDLVAAAYAGITLLHGCEPYFDRPPASDFDGDGFSDLLWLHQYYSPHHVTNLWLWGRSGTALGCGTECPGFLRASWRPQAVGDFNGDGNSDVFWRDSATGDNYVMRVGYYRQKLVGVTNQDWQVVGAGDFDGDDRSDLLWRNGRTGANAIWRSGDFATQQSTRAVTDLAWKVAAIGDFNGDERADILWRHSVSGHNAIWQSGRFESQQAITAVTGLQWKVVGAGDFNADGIDDVVWRNASNGTNAIWLSGNYRTQQAVTTVTNRAWTIAAVADYNGDGRSDLMWRNTSSGANIIWLSAIASTQQAVDPTVTTHQLIR